MSNVELSFTFRSEQHVRIQKWPTVKENSTFEMEREKREIYLRKKDNLGRHGRRKGVGR